MLTSVPISEMSSSEKRASSARSRRLKRKSYEVSSLLISARSTMHAFLQAIDLGEREQDGTWPLTCDKDGRLGALLKWIACLEKISDIERKLHQSDVQTFEDESPLTSEDLEILERYLAARKFT